jgi:diguanylate cyclase (GGDEF)-like protein/PAS domain S-box-containing protein
MHVGHAVKQFVLTPFAQISIATAAKIFVLLVCITVITIEAWSSLKARDLKLHDAEVTALNLARGLAQHANDTFRTSDIILIELVRRRHEQNNVQDAAQWERLRKVMDQQVANLPFLQRLTLIDERGQGWVASQTPASRVINVADRDYFRFHQSHAANTPYVGKAIRARSTGEWIVTLSRRINHADGRFAGVALASIRMAYFQRYYASLDIGEKGVIMLAIRNGTLLVRRPFVEEKIGSILRDSPFWREPDRDAPFGVVTAYSTVDGIERLGAYGHLQEYPLLVYASLSKQEILASWWRSTYLNAVFVLLLTGLLAWFGWRLVRQIRIRMQAESALQQSEMRWQYALEGVGDGLWDWNNQTGEILFSRQWKAMLGYTEEEITNHTSACERLIHPDDLDAVRKAFDAYACGEKTLYEKELRMLCKDQSWRWILSRGMIVERDAAGQPVRTIGTHADVTVRKTMERELKISEQRFRLLVEEVHDYSIVMLDVEGRIVTWNKGAQRIMGYSEDEILNKDFSSFYCVEKTAYGQPQNALTVAAQAGKFTEEGWRLRKDGTTFFACVVITAVYNDVHKLIGFAKVTRDISESRLLEKELRESEMFVRAMIDALSAQICVLDEQHTIIAVNQAWRDFYDANTPGFPQHGIGLRYRIFCDALSFPKAASAKQLTEGIAATMRGETDAYELEYACQAPKGQCWFRVKVTRFGSEAPKVVLAHENITELKMAEIDLQFSGAVYRALGEAIMVLDEQNSIVAINPAFTQFTGYPELVIIGKPMQFLQAEQMEGEFKRGMKQLLDKTGHWQGKIWLRKLDGSKVMSWLMIDTIFDEHDQVRQRVGMFSKITEHKLAEQTIWQQANFDALTGLPNRSMFLDRLEYEIKKARRTDAPLALLFIDLDRFKDINDTLGHDVGDELLKKTAQRLLACVRAADTVARLGGDEFTVILSEISGTHDAASIAQNILNRMAEPFQLGSEIAFISASIGVTHFPHDTDRIDALLKNADQAMYAAKDQGRNRFKYFTASMQEVAQSRMRMVNDLRAALANNQFRVVYQPIVTLSNGKIAKAEALIRWQHPQRGQINPADFIPLAEETGMIVDIGNWVFAEVTRQLSRWRSHHDDMLQVSVNISPAQFRTDVDRTLVWLDYMELMAVPGPCIAVEITEGMLVEATMPIATQLHQLREAGMQVSLDDFGTGYSSLSYLKKFDIDTLKIDQSFVRNMTPGSDDLALCEAIIVMAHKLGIQVVAEGIETREQRNMLVTAGCDFGQGYYFSRPVSPDKFCHLWQGQDAGRPEVLH